MIKKNFFLKFKLFNIIMTVNTQMNHFVLVHVNYYTFTNTNN